MKRDIAAWVGLLVFCGCVGVSQRGGESSALRGRSVASRGRAAPTAEVSERARMTRDARMLGMFSQELRALAVEFESLQQRLSGRAPAAVSSDENDEIEGLLYRYVICRESLVELASDYADARLMSEAPPALRSKGALLGMFARLLIRYYDTLLADLFTHEPTVVAKFNAAYPDAALPEGTYDRMLESVSSIRNRERQEAAWRLLEEDLGNPYSALARQVAADPECAVLVRAVRSLHPQQEQRSRSLLQKQASRDPNVQVRTQPARVAVLAERARAASETSLEAAVALDSRGVFELIADVISPPLKLTAAQHQQLADLLEPGDVLLTFRKGYLSNLFFGGKFIHGITYVGETAGSLTPSAVGPLDLIEAVAPEVAMNSLHYIVDGYISRMAVVRPRLTPQQRQEVMAQLRQYMGRDYDLAFNFRDERRLCCTEVIYHLLDGRGPIQFKLVKRLGLMTLSADDILSYALASEANGLDVVCVLDEKSGSKGKQAILLTGAAASEHLRRLLD